MYRLPPIVTGGQTPGTAQLAATASTRLTPESRSSVTSSPVAVSIALMRSSRSGHSWEGSLCSITSRRMGSVTVSVDRATLPILCSFSAFEPGCIMALRKSSVIASTPTFGFSSVVDGTICRSKSASRPSPLTS